MIKLFKLLEFYIMWASSTLFGLFHQERYCPEWDRALGALLDKYADSAIVSPHTTTINGVEIWTDNAFYSYGHIWVNDIDERRPSLYNMYRLWMIGESHRKKQDERKRGEYMRKMQELINDKVT